MNKCHTESAVLLSPQALIQQKSHIALKEKCTVIGFLLVVFVASYFLMAYIAENVQLDMKAHAAFIPLMIAGTKKIPHFLWHALVWSFSKLTGQPYLTGAIWVTSLSITLLAFIKSLYFTFALKNTNIRYPLILLLSALSMILMPIYLPFFNPYLYLGQGGVGVWHNPTLLMVKPFAFVSVLSILWSLEKKETKIMLFSLVVTTASILAKPNFILILLPALLSYTLLIHRDEKADRKTGFFLASIVLLSAIVLAMQYYMTYLDIHEHNHLAIRPGAVWTHYTPSVCISILTALAFPLLVGVGNKRQSRLLLFCWLLIFYGMFEAYFFVELHSDNSVLYDWNFIWGYLCATDLLFTASLIHYVVYYADYKKIAGVGNLLISFHGLSGLVYLKHLVMDNNFL